MSIYNYNTFSIVAATLKKGGAGRWVYPLGTRQRLKAP